jgi:formylglycine-generating enzyme required for sulfatase activity
MTEESGIVLVLIPGGRFTMGAQSTDPSELNHDPLAQPDESAVHEIELSPFFISKFEMSQSQWLRLVGTNPSDYGPHKYESTMNANGQPGSLLHPVERVSWDQCAQTLGWAGLTLPTEAQWEYACRAGTTTPYWSGAEVQDLQGVANVSDAYGKSHGNEHYTRWEAALDDGQTVHAPIGRYRPNSFGLFDTHGNVWEWCRDAYWPYSNPIREGDGERQSSDPLLTSNSRVWRGGSFAGAAEFARSAIRRQSAANKQANGIGVRPARSIDA